MKRATCILVALILLALPVSASADVDPASDVLLFQNEYFPRVQPPSAQLKGTLTALTDEANKADYGIKVAIIGARLDLGGVPQLYRHPDQYAKYLGLELHSATGLVQPLVVVMRGGIAVYGADSEAKAIEGLTVPPKATADDLTRVAIEATKTPRGGGRPSARHAEREEGPEEGQVEQRAAARVPGSGGPAAPTGPAPVAAAPPPTAKRACKCGYPGSRGPRRLTN